MKHIRQFEKFDKVNEVFGLALIAGVGLAMAAPTAYRWAKNFWSKNVIGSKYKETGNKETVVTKLPKEISPAALGLTWQAVERGEVVTELKEYKDDLGNIFWGYDHLYADGEYVDVSQMHGDADFYTALFKEEDLPALKTFLQNSERYSSRKSNSLTKPNPIEMVYVKEGPRYRV